MIKKFSIYVFVRGILFGSILFAILSFFDTKKLKDFTTASNNQEVYSISEEILQTKSLKISEQLDFNKIIKEQKKIDTLKEEEKNQIRKLIDGLNEIQNHQDLESFSKILKDNMKNINIVDEVESETYVNYLNSKTIIIAVAVGFLSIFLIIQVESNRLDNERKHNREKANENLSDILNFSMKLMEEINRKHVKFMFTGKELKDICKSFTCQKIFTIGKTGIRTNEEYDYLKRLYTFDYDDKKNYCLFDWLCNPKYTEDTEQKKDSELLDKVYFSISFLKTIILDKELREKLEIEEEELPKLQQLYNNAVLKNYLEYLSSTRTEGEIIHSINEEVKKIPINIEEIILKRDFKIDDISSKKYLDILDNIKKFENIQEIKESKKSSEEEFRKINKV